MSVTETVTLEDQPSAGGRIQLIPLGGNGVTAPKSMYEVIVNLAHDAGGGTATITLNGDPRFSSLCTLMNGVYTSAAGGIEMLFGMRKGTPPVGPLARGFINAIPIATVGAISLGVWNPPPIMTMDEWTMTCTNVTGDSQVLNAWFYNFDRRILELSPMWQILANLPRPGLIDAAPT